jgi:hypothetical protein
MALTVEKNAKENPKEKRLQRQEVETAQGRYDSAYMGQTNWEWET